MNHFLKSLLNLLQYCFCFMFWFYWPQGMWDLSFPTMHQSCTPCTGRWSLNHCTTREVSHHRFLPKRFLSPGRRQMSPGSPSQGATESAASLVLEPLGGVRRATLRKLRWGTRATTQQAWLSHWKAQPSLLPEGGRAGRTRVRVRLHFMAATLPSGKKVRGQQSSLAFHRKGHQAPH